MSRLTSEHRDKMRLCSPLLGEVTERELLKLLNSHDEADDEIANLKREKASRVKFIGSLSWELDLPKASHSPAEDYIIAIRALKNRVEKLEGAVVKYAWHDRGACAYSKHSQNACDCGFKEVMDSISR